MKTVKKVVLPAHFRPILWSYDFASINPTTHKKTIILQAVNYGDLRHWRWIGKQYGAAAIRRVLRDARNGSVRPSVRPLANVVFGAAV